MTPFVFDVFKVKSVFFYVRFDGNGTIGGSRPSDKRGTGHPDPEIWRKGSLSGGRGGGQLPRAPPLDPPLETNDNYSLSRRRNLTSVSSAEILVLGP